MTASRERPIALIGLSGAGKSTIALGLAERLAGVAIDLDARFEQEAGATIADFFAREGEAAFRRREHELLARAIDEDAAVIACGGGVVLDPEHRVWLRERCKTVWLDVQPAAAAARIGTHAASRPLLKGELASRLEALRSEREALYRESCHVRVATDGCSPEEVVEAVIAVLDARDREGSSE